MTTIHAELFGDKAVLPRTELDTLLNLARQHENVELIAQQDNVSTAELMLLAEQGGAFDFLAEDEDVYTIDDLKVRYK